MQNYKNRPFIKFNKHLINKKIICIMLRNTLVLNINNKSLKNILIIIG